MQKHIYFLNENNTGALYGVGTYMNHLLQVLPPERFRITILYFYTHFEELTVKNNGNIRSIYFPEPPTRTKPVQYHRSIFYILFPYIEKEEENILHLNFRSCIDLVALLRLHFSFKVVLTWHFFTGVDFASGRVFEQITEGKGEGETVTFNRAYKETIRRETELMHRYCDKIVLVEIIEENISGELLDLYTEEDEKIAADRLANALLSLLADPDRQAHYAKNGRKRYLENFGTESFKKKMCDLYDKLEETE